MGIVDIEERYAIALNEFISGRGEEALQRAYEAGRDILADGGGCLDVLKLHEECLLPILAAAESVSDGTRIARSAAKFLAESLSPFEMTHRGFQDAITELKKRAEELASMNTWLESEINERERAESELRKSETKYRTLVDTARDVIYTLSPDGVITTLNPAFEQLTGWSREEWVGRHFAPIVHPDDIPGAVNKIQQALEGKNPPVIQLRVMVKSGEFIIGEFVSTPQFHEGRVIGIIGIARDITERKRTEALLLESEEKFRLITENMADLIVVLDTAGRRLYNSPSYQALLGNPSSLQGTDSFFNVHPEDRERIKKIFRETAETGIGRRTEYRFVGRDGAVRHIESQGSVILNQEGKTDKVIVVSRDITDRRQAEERLKESEKQLSAAQQVARIGSWEWEIASNKIRWSEEMFRIFQAEPNEFEHIYDVYSQRVSPEERETFKKIIQEAIRSHGSFHFEHLISLPDGTVCNVEARGEVILDPAGNPVKLMGTTQDITERKRADESVRELAKRVVAAQEDERRRVARELHDNICQRLSAIKMDMGALEEESANKRTRMYRHLQRLKKQVGTTINEIRVISAGLRPSTLDDFGLPNALERLCREFEKKQGIKVKLQMHGLENVTINIDKSTAFYRIAQEAFTNIAKHSHAKKVTVNLAVADSAIMMNIHDNGKGFEPDNRKRLKEYSGNGLKNMRERSVLLGGIFRLTSARNKGTTIYLELPLAMAG
ncbi:MAG TPA: PAS domain S-box protein [Bacteroidota bacterium]|nr:PAS domain S-box protein [Bacteroidota bacterium]